MKKITLLLILALFTGFFFTGCEEEEEPAQLQLSEFIVGGNRVYTQIE